MAGQPNKIRNSKNGKGKYLRYTNEGKKLRHKVSKIAHRIKNYKIQPPLILKGFDKQLAGLVRARLTK